MYIKKFHIEEFGPLTDVSAENLPQTLAVFLGDNEAGKSSSMEFIRTMLTGIPNRRDLFYQSMKTFRGGSLLAEDEKYGEMLVERNFSARSNRNLKVFGENGKKIDNTVFLNAIDNIPQDVYRLIFGFTLAELQNFSAFQDAGVFENILGASYGLGLISPDKALNALRQDMEQLYKPKGKSSVLQGLFAKWKEENALFEQTNRRIEKFDELQNKLQNAKLSCEEVKQEKIRIKDQEEELHRLLALWGQWKKWADLQKEFISMKAVSSNFCEQPAENAEILFAKILEQRRLKEEQAEQLLASQREYEARLRKFSIKTSLISQYLAIKDLAPAFARAEKTLTEIPVQQVQIEQSFHALVKQNSKMLDKWHAFCGNPAVYDFAEPEDTLKHFAPILEDTLFLDDLERCAAKTREAKAHVQNAKTAFEYARRDAEKAERKYQAVLEEKQQEQDNFNKNSLLRQEDIDFEQDLQIWQNRLQETQDKENEYLDISAKQCAEFLNQAKALGFADLQGCTISKDNAKEFLQIYMQLAQIVRETNSREKQITAMAEEHKTLLQKAADLEKQHMLRKKQAELNAEDQKRIEKIQAIEKAVQTIFRQLEEADAAKPRQPKQKPEKLPAYMHIPSAACLIFGTVFLLLRLGSGSAAVQTFLGTLNIPLVLPLILLGAGTGLEALFRRSGKKQPDTAAETPNGEHIDTLLQDLQELLDVQEKLLQTFYPEQIPGRRQNTDGETVPEQSGDLLQFGQTLSEKLHENELSPLGRHIARAKERASLHSHYAQKFQSSKPAEPQIDTEQIADLRRRADKLENTAKNELQSLHCQVERMENIPAFFKIIKRLDLLVQEINELSAKVHDCHKVYEDFIVWIKTAVPHLFETFAQIPSDKYLSALTEYRQKIRDEQFRQIQEMHGAIFASSLSALEESKEHCAAVEKTLEERKKNLGQIYAGLADLLQKHGFLPAERLSAFTQQLHAEEQEQDIFSGTFLNIKQCLEALYRLHTLYTEQEERKAKLAAMHETLKDFTEPLRTILMRCDFSPKEAIRSEKDYLQVYQDLAKEAEQENTLFRQKESLMQEYGQVREKQEQAARDVQSVEQALQELYATANVENEDALKALFAKIKESERYTQQAVIIEESLREEPLPKYTQKSSAPACREYKELPQQKPLPEIFAFFDENAKSRFEKELADLQEERAGLERIENHIQELKGKVEAESSFVYEESLSNEAGYRMKKTEEEIKNAYNKWLELAFAKEILEQAKQRYEEHSQPQIVQIASEFFTQITDGAWQGIKVRLDDRSVGVLDEKGTVLPAEMLSQGAKEQLYLSLRLAHIKHRSMSKRPLPLLMDDILVNFDERRMRNTAKVLNLMVQETLNMYNNQQILYYTCHERTAQILQETVQGTKIYRVENKKIFEDSTLFA